MSEDPDSVVMRHGLEDAEEKELMDRAAPLAASLTPGINYFEPKPYRDLVYFFLEGTATDAALESGKFTVARFVRIVRVREGSLVTLSELARITGIPRVTLWDLADRCRFPFKRVGNKKLFNIHDIRTYLSDRR